MLNKNYYPPACPCTHHRLFRWWLVVYQNSMMALVLLPGWHGVNIHIDDGVSCPFSLPVRRKKIPIKDRGSRSYPPPVRGGNIHDKVGGPCPSSSPDLGTLSMSTIDCLVLCTCQCGASMVTIILVTLTRLLALFQKSMTAFLALPPALLHPQLQQPHTISSRTRL